MGETAYNSAENHFGTQKILELQANNHTAQLGVYRMGAQVFLCRIDGEDILLPRSNPRGLSEHVVDALGNTSIDSTGEGGTFPAYQFGRAEGQPIHGYAPINTWRVVEESPQSVTLVTGGENQINFAKAFHDDVISMERTLGIKADIHNHPHFQFTTTAINHHPRNTVQINYFNSPDMAEHFYIAGNANVATVLVAGKQIPLSTFRQKGVHVVTKEPVSYLNHGDIPSNQLEEQPGLMLIFPDGPEGRVVVMQSLVTITSQTGEILDMFSPKEYTAYQKPGSEKSFCIEPQTGSHVLTNGDRMILAIDVTMYNSFAEFAEIQK